MGVSLIFEGNEGAGKTTRAKMARLLIEATTPFPVEFVREPGGTPVASLIRTLLKSEHGRGMHPNTNMLLFSAARNELIEQRIEPFLRNNPGGVIIGDRGWPSTLALQLAEGALDSYAESVQEPLMRLYPDKVLYVDVPVEESIVRLEGARYQNNREIDWRDTATETVLNLYRDNYLSLVKRYSKIELIDGFEDPWLVAMKTRESVLRMLIIQNENNDFIRSTAQKELESFNLDNLNDFARQASREGITIVREDKKVTERIDIEQMYQMTESAREILGARSREDLRSDMYADWASRGIESPYNSRERL